MVVLQTKLATPFAQRTWSLLAQAQVESQLVAARDVMGWKRRSDRPNLSGAGKESAQSFEQSAAHPTFHGHPTHPTDVKVVPPLPGAKVTKILKHVVHCG
jgi:hypothetical protein